MPAVVLLLCGVLGWLGYESMRGPTRSEISGAAARVPVPAELKLVDEYWIGNAICLEDCNELYRTYSSPLTKQETYRAFSAALEQAGFRCVSWCEGFRDSAGLYTGWDGPDGRTLNLTVTSIDDPADARTPARTRFDPARAVYAEIKIG